MSMCTLNTSQWHVQQHLALRLHIKTERHILLIRSFESELSPKLKSSTAEAATRFHCSLHVNWIQRAVDMFKKAPTQI